MSKNKLIAKIFTESQRINVVDGRPVRRRPGEPLKNDIRSGGHGKHKRKRKRKDQ